MIIELRKKDELIPSDRVFYLCPGCFELHSVPVDTEGKDTPEGPIWKYNYNSESPTIFPSMRHRIEDRVCHYIMKDGKLEYQNDCTHHLKGRVVPMEDMLE